MQYYFKIQGKAFGPFGEDQLKEMKTKGKLSRTSEISENKVEWFPAENFDFLFPSPLASSQTTSSGASATYSLSVDSGTTNWASSEPAIWFYSVNGTEGFGPVTQTAIVQMIQTGTLRGESLVWQQGQNAQQIRTVQTFAGSFSSSAIPSVTPLSYQQQNGFNPENTGLFCTSCGNPVVRTAQICPRCGSFIHNSETILSCQGAKSRLVYVLLALFVFGTFGSHNFYAGRTQQAVVQLIFGLTIIGLLVTGIWAIIDAITVTKDGNGIDFI
jgi:TM2 domain-containing membrane protein YozV